MSVSPAPINQQVSDENGLPTLPWTLFFNQTFQGDAGDAFAPSFVSLTEVGTATYNARFYRISQYLIYFRIDVIPSTSTSAVAGTTYIDNFPLDITGDGFCTIVSGNSGGAIGMVRASDNRIYVPSWSTVADKVTILGICEAR
jgi:hypothetical protein